MSRKTYIKLDQLNAEIMIAVDDKVAAETARAETEEATLLAAIGSEAARAEGAEATLLAAIGSEHNRAEDAEAGLAASVAAEVARAEGAEASLVASVTAEVTRRTAAEAAISAALATEVARSVAMEVANNADLATEVARAESAEAALSTRLSNAINSTDGDLTSISSLLEAVLLFSENSEDIVDGFNSLTVKSLTNFQAIMDEIGYVEGKRCWTAYYENDMTIAPECTTDGSKTTLDLGTLATIRGETWGDFELSVEHGTQVDVSLNGLKLFLASDAGLTDGDYFVDTVAGQVVMDDIGPGDVVVVDIYLTHALRGTLSIDTNAVVINLPGAPNVGEA